ncbi:hypothetical protein [uncultured Eudoraea sp.]|uniref:hypothetical protein n=1 Tax=uncultured Eudoraea sp. TaxID=1035614 RepID=UPI002615C8D8|nr:hypothetical protein [uncultured Eudoraea sp.]
MKKLILCALLTVAFSINAQESYWTYYNFSVEPQNEAAVLKLVEDYFKEHKQEGVTVRFFENHFTDSDNNYSHSIGFSGSLDALGNQYSGAQSDSWDLFLTRVNQLIESSFSSSMGSIISTYGALDTLYPIQNYVYLHVNDTDAFLKEREKYFSSFNSDVRLTVLGNISSGRSPHGETHMVIMGYKDFKSAMAGMDALLSPDQVEIRRKAWKEFGENNGGVSVIRTGTRILLGKW